VAVPARTVDYKSDSRHTGLKGGATAPVRPGPTPSVAQPTAVATGLEEFLQAFARAVQQFHTYPPASTMCVNALDTCMRALVALQDREHVHCRVSPRDLIVEERAMGRGTVVEQELSRRLHTASIAEVTIDRAVTARELSRFCLDLLKCSVRSSAPLDLTEMLAEHGVDRISLLPARRPEVLGVSAPTEAQAALVASERHRRDQLLAAPGAVNYLYPPDKGWVRLDPWSRLESVSLVELALLADDPAALATMLTRLTDDSPEEQDLDEALSRRFSDVTLLFSALEPRVARVMFSRLARAVLDLSPERRQALLRRTILPGLLDGRTDGSILRDFPDIDLADSLCLLLDLETAAPEVVTTALARLDLPAERQEALCPLIDERLRRRGGAGTLGDGLDAHARRLTTAKDHRARSFAEFSAFDVALDADTGEALGRIRARISGPETIDDRLDCLGRLIGLEPNPEAVLRLLDLAAPLVAQLERNGEWGPFAAWLHRCRTLADTHRESRPDVAEALASRLAELCTVDRATRLVELAREGDSARLFAQHIVDALGGAMGPALLGVVQVRERDSADTRTRTAAQILCECATTVAAALVEHVEKGTSAGQRVMARVFGLAGAGFEAPLGALLDSGDEQTAREALRSLVRIGTPHAAAIVAARVERQGPWASAAEESLWHFPGAEAQRQARALLGRREFVLRHAEVAGRLFDRAVSGSRPGVDSVLATLSPLRLRFWNPPLARLGRKAKALMHA
jgi:hypothetical protein